MAALVRGSARARKHIPGAVQIAAGLALAVFPATFIAVFARIAPIETQGYLAVSLAVGQYVAVIVCAFVVESRLATPEADHSLALPWWMTLLSILSGLLLIFASPIAVAPVLMIGVIGLSSGLLMARSIGVVNGRWKLEAAAATFLLIACALALFLANQRNEDSVRVLALGALLTILARRFGTPRIAGGGMPPDFRRAAWVTGETAIMGFALPALTSVILITLGPAASVGFRVVSTISGALEPVLAYGRFRMLAHGHRGEILIVAATLGAGIAIILVADISGLWGLVFGPAWANVAAGSLALACLWKGLMLFSTVPFAALRRAGQAALVFWIRGASTVLYLLLGITFVFAFRTNTAVFLAFVLAEMVSMMLYVRGARSIKKPPSPGSSTTSAG